MPYWESIQQAKSNLSHVTASVEGHRYSKVTQYSTQAVLQIDVFMSSVSVPLDNFSLSHFSSFPSPSSSYSFSSNPSPFSFSTLLSPLSLLYLHYPSLLSHRWKKQQEGTNPYTVSRTPRSSVMRGSALPLHYDRYNSHNCYDLTLLSSKFSSFI